MKDTRPGLLVLWRREIKLLELLTNQGIYLFRKSKLAAPIARFEIAISGPMNKKLVNKSKIEREKFKSLIIYLVKNSSVLENI